MSSVPFFFLVAAAALIPLAYYLMRQRFERRLDLPERSLVATNFGFFNALFAFLLGFAVATLWSQFLVAEEASIKEANAVNNLYRLSMLLPSAREFRSTIMRYNQSIIDDEWEKMASDEVSEKTQGYYQEIWVEVLKMNPSNEKGKILYEQILVKMQELAEYRMRRVVILAGHLYPIMWFIIIVGSIFATIGFFYTATEKRGVQLIFDSIFIIMLLLTIWLIGELNKPYKGSICVPSRPFVIVGERMSSMEVWLEKQRLRESPGQH